MFAEEHAGAASRKRQEENKAKRRQLKEQQERRAAAAAAASKATTPAAVGVGSASAGDVGPAQQQSAGITFVGSTVNNKISAAAPSTPISSQSKPIGTYSQSTRTASLPLAAAVGADNNKPSAVAIALQQRMLRQEAQQREKAALIIQSLYRAHWSNFRLLQEQSKVLTQRLQDIKTLRTLLAKASNNSNYIPPPATATILVQQLLLLTRSFPYRRRHYENEIVAEIHIKLRNPSQDLALLQQILQYVIMPGLTGDDESLDPILPWLQSSHGRRRLDNLLRLCLLAATTSHPQNVSQETLVVVSLFLRLIVGTKNANDTATASASSAARNSIVTCCRKILINSTTTSSNIPTSLSTMSIPEVTTKDPLKRRLCQPPPAHAFLHIKLDLIQILRRFLLYSVGGGNPIPVHAEKLRDGCISNKDREQVDILFQLVLDVVQSTSVPTERHKLRARFVSDILTVPLLTWKASIACIATFVSRPSQQQQQQSTHEPFIELLQAFVDVHGATLSAGRITSLLPSTDVPLTSCPATATQCFLANLTQIGRLCTSINGTNASLLDASAASLYFHLVATLLDVVPLGTFSSRDSAVEWISDGKGQFTPIVLSPIITEHCKLLLVDSFVRDLFNNSIDSNTLNTDHVLKLKNDTDVSHERDLHEAGTSAMELAAKEARVDRAKGFWNASTWARTITKSVTMMLSAPTGNNTPVAGNASNPSPGMLVNTTLISRKLAHGGQDAAGATKRGAQSTVAVTSDRREPYTTELLLALCRAYGTILARWGGGGKDDIVGRGSGIDDSSSKKSQHFQTDQATSKPDACTLALLNVLCFATPIVRTAWGIIQSDSRIAGDVKAVVSEARNASPIRAISIRPKYPTMRSSNSDWRMEQDGAALLYVFVCVLCHTLIITDDVEIHDMERPLPLHQLRRCIQVLKELLCRACRGDDDMTTSTIKDVNESVGGVKANHFGLALIAASARAMRDLYDRSSRRPFCIPKFWLVDGLMEKEMRSCKTHKDFVRLLSTPVLRLCPFLVSFKRRLSLFERIVTTSRIEIQGMNDPNPFNPNQLKPGIPVRIMRGRVLEDGLATLNKLGPNLRHRIAVQYLNEAGARESGVDVGGLFKEFWTDLCALAFNPNYALFRTTEGAGHCLYPNPSSGAAHGSDHIILFEFLGRILGKALYEGITIHPRFAHFFLSFLRGDYNYFHMLPDLSTLDPQLYNNLMFLKTYDGDAEDLCLTFTVAVENFGGTTEVALIPNGAEIPVTNTNKQRYIGLVAKYHVVDRVKEQSEAFTRGLWDVIDRAWLRLFNEPELQVLISGATDGKIDVQDMRANARYVGGYTTLDPNIRWFWNVMGSLSSKQQADLLRFVTSCERPPPLGFSSMNPPFTIQRVGILRDGDQLPTASTCFNTLKLPTYSSEKVLRQRLIYAIESGAGFELT